MLKQYLPKLSFDKQTLAWFLLPVLVAFVLLSFDRFGVEHQFIKLFANHIEQANLSDNQTRYLAQMWLSATCWVLMVILPILYFWIFFPNNHHLGLKFSKQHLPLYLLLFTLMLPIIFVASAQDQFKFFYPLYNPANLHLWIIFEVVYLSQFVCVEFFFRGPILLKLNERYGYAAIGFMMVPYALIHIYKPFPEALGSIVAGLLLGYLAIRLRSIWPGVFLHCSVALTMDVLAMYQSGRLALL